MSSANIYFKENRKTDRVCFNFAQHPSFLLMFDDDCDGINGDDDNEVRLEPLPGKNELLDFVL